MRSVLKTSLSTVNCQLSTVFSTSQVLHFKRASRSRQNSQLYSARYLCQLDRGSPGTSARQIF
ncbi:MAG: hypothetical protein HC849_29715 [Oscillatoriales cyanobacterium RU_3_3]|nr:hypothetical protein [Microcoleus sp. SU_5_6]NJL66611.1 hypothetical protein [Microcoleus sp. SM1_3_4]NJM63401.1 hypothetical protein [Oscillatoriales cyanobacterium RU_3_3]NJR21361.1 hypothetical protein [Richelia sp. CSU_2_1]